MPAAQEITQDPGLEALSNLSEVATESANDLLALNGDLDTMRRHRALGWSWRRVLAAADSPNVLTVLAKIVAALGRAGSGLRRALARGLRDEGLQITEIARLFDVSRQRVSALLRPQRGDES